MDDINVVIRATLYFYFGDILVLSLRCRGVSTSHFPEITWTPDSVASQRFTFLLMTFQLMREVFWSVILATEAINANANYPVLLQRITSCVALKSPDKCLDKQLQKL